MAIFQCDRCGCRDNSACGGTYNTKRMNERLFEGVKNGEALCVACTPSQYKSGAPYNEGGKWHNIFDRLFLPKGEFATDSQGNLVHKETGMSCLEYADKHPEKVRWENPKC